MGDLQEEVVVQVMAMVTGMAMAMETAKLGIGCQSCNSLSSHCRRGPLKVLDSQSMLAPTLTSSMFQEGQEGQVLERELGLEVVGMEEMELVSAVGQVLVWVQVLAWVRVEQALVLALDQVAFRP